MKIKVSLLASSIALLISRASVMAAGATDEASPGSLPNAGVVSPTAIFALVGISFVLMGIIKLFRTLTAQA